MTGFDLDVYRGEAGQTPWALTVSGKVYISRPVSAEQVLLYQAECMGASPRRMRKALTKLLRAAFPWRPSFVWRGDPVRIIVAARPHEQRALLTDFFASLAGPKARQSVSSTSGTP